MNKKIFRSSIVLGNTFFIFIMVSTAMAGFIGNPRANVDEGEIALGLVIDMANRDYEWGKWEGDADTDRNLIKATYGVRDDLNIYGMVGQTKFHDMDDSGTGLGIGVKYDLEIADIDCGLVAQALKYSGEGKDAGAKVEVDMTDIDVAFGAAREIDNGFTINGGIMLSTDSGTADYKAFKDEDIDEKDMIGAFAGVEFCPTGQITIGAEYRAICESSISLVLSYLFD